MSELNKSPNSRAETTVQLMKAQRALIESGFMSWYQEAVKEKRAEYIDMGNKLAEGEWEESTLGDVLLESLPSFDKALRAEAPVFVYREVFGSETKQTKTEITFAKIAASMSSKGVTFDIPLGVSVIKAQEHKQEDGTAVLAYGANKQVFNEDQMRLLDSVIEISEAILPVEEFWEL